MATSAKLGYGSLFKVHDDNSPGQYVTVSEVTSIEGPSITKDPVEVTHMESPDGYREFITGLKDGGEVSLEMNFVPGSAGMTLLLAEFERSQASQCKIVLSTTPAYAWTFDAIMTSMGHATPLDDKMTTTVTFKITGKSTLALDS